MTERKGKRILICLSSSEEEEEDEEVEDSDNEEEKDDVDSDEEDDDEDDDEDEDDSDGDDDDDDESLCNKVICRLKEGSGLDSLNLKECKAYLRKHDLRLAGTKAFCIQRINEHWRIKNGSGEAFYPRSTFIINCTGDVCKGDVVLFTQKVYEKFNKVTRHGRLLGKRIIAGRVVKESYGASKQQHTFTVEVLWSKGINRLPPLFPLLVKGRNLYKMRTFRRHWSNESERIKVLAEKHKRGTAARLVREMKKRKKTLSSNGGSKRQKQFHHTRSSQFSCGYLLLCQLHFLVQYQMAIRLHPKHTEHVKIFCYFCFITVLTRNPGILLCLSTCPRCNTCTRLPVVIVKLNQLVISFLG